jgi:O-antigen ligase
MSSVVWSLEPAVSAWAGAFLVAGALYLAAGQELGRTPRGGPLALAVLAITGGAVAITSIAGYWLGRDQWVMDLAGQRVALGPFGYANALAGLLLLTLPISFAVLLLAWRRGRSRPWMLVQGGSALLVAAQVYAIYESGSRGAALALVGAALIVFGARYLLLPGLSWFSAASPSRKLTAAFGALLIAAVLVVLLPNRIEASTQSENHRVATWKAAAVTAMESPLRGWGAGTFFTAYQPNRTSSATRFAHNLILQQWVELGVVGVVILAGTLGGLLVRPFLPGNRSHLTMMRVVLLVAPVAFILQNLIDLTWYFPSLAYLFLFVLGWVTGEDLYGEEETQRQP